jgi:hypothetical protein
MRQIWIGFLLAAFVAIVGTGSLMGTLRKLTRQQASTIIWNLDGTLFYGWPFAGTLDSVIVGQALECLPASNLFSHCSRAQGCWGSCL